MQLYDCPTVYMNKPCDIYIYTENEFYVGNCCLTWYGISFKKYLKNIVDTSHRTHRDVQVCMQYIGPHYDHDDVIKWKHFPRYWPFVRVIHRSPLNSRHKSQSRRALMFSLARSWKNGSVNNREASDLRRHRAHYDVIVMTAPYCIASVLTLLYIYIMYMLYYQSQKLRHVSQSTELHSYITPWPVVDRQVISHCGV